jgi:hypothetical protein
MLITALLLVTAAACIPAQAGDVVELFQDDFTYGTYIIDRPGRYRLAEDISFNPNSTTTLGVDAYRAGFPLPGQFADGTNEPFVPGGPDDPRYDPAAFGIGFFAAIVIAADGVDLDLNGYTIDQSEEHALLQRFFAVIELADRPFIPNQGPHSFGSQISSAKNVVIRNGTIGRSAHHGIHGNGNENIIVANVDFIDYEVAAVALNGVRGLLVRNVNATNFKGLKVLGTFSSAQFIKPYVDFLAGNSATTLDLGGQSLTASAIRDALRASINHVHADVLGKGGIDRVSHPGEYALFHNPFGVIDGNSYSFLVNSLGVAVNGFPTQPAENAAEDIFFSNVDVNAQHAFINETVALSEAGNAVIDPVGAVFQLLNTHPDIPGKTITIDADGRYVGNVVANAQLLVAKAAHKGEFSGSNLDVSRLNMTPALVDWAESGRDLWSFAPKGSDNYLCNGDSMFHVNKGVIGFKMDAAKRVIMRNTSVNDIVNLGAAGSDICAYVDGKSHPLATLPGYGGARTRAYSFSGSRDVFIVNAAAANVNALEGSATGVDLMTDSERIRLVGTKVTGVNAGFTEAFGPNETPKATGIRVEKDVANVRVRAACVRELEGLDEAEFDDLSGLARIRKACR